MKTLEQRVHAALPNGPDSPWLDLIRLFHTDPEAFYLLACDPPGDDASHWINSLASLAAEIRTAIQESYEIEATPSGAALLAASGKTTPIPTALLSQVVPFLRAVDGKVSSHTPGKDYVGTSASEAEIRFKLGDRSTWPADHTRLQARLHTGPLVLRLHNEELNDLASQPAHVTHGLLNSARKTILAPTSVFRGLNRGADCPAHLKHAWAFSGKPRQAFDNEGRPFPAPTQMVYVVYADESGFVFDWDWVQESPHEPGYPIDWHLRFANLYHLEQDAVLQLPPDLRPGTFDPTQACYSSRGDCIFCYMSDDISYATRINADLTIFTALGTDRYTGFKIKNVQRILHVDQTIEITDAPGLSVSVDSVLLATLKRHEGRDGDVRVYRVLIRALYQSPTPPPYVRLPRPPAQFVNA